MPWWVQVRAPDCAPRGPWVPTIVLPACLQPPCIAKGFVQTPTDTYRKTGQAVGQSIKQDRQTLGSYKAQIIVLKFYRPQANSAFSRIYYAPLLILNDLLCICLKLSKKKKKLFSNALIEHTKIVIYRHLGSFFFLSLP